MELTTEELRQLFDAVYERDMSLLRKQIAEATKPIDYARQEEETMERSRRSLPEGLA